MFLEIIFLFLFCTNSVFSVNSFIQIPSVEDSSLSSPKLRINIEIPSASSNFTWVMNVPNSLPDAFNRDWNLETPLFLQLNVLSSLHSNLLVNEQYQFSPAYELNGPWDPQSPCPQDGVCCGSTVYSLTFNTSINCIAFSSFNIDFISTLSFRQGSISYTLENSRLFPKFSVPDGESTIFAYNDDSHQVVVCYDSVGLPSEAVYIIPKEFLSSSNNSLGVSLSNWKAAKSANCSLSATEIPLSSNFGSNQLSYFSPANILVSNSSSNYTFTCIDETEWCPFSLLFDLTSNILASPSFPIINMISVETHPLYNQTYLIDAGFSDSHHLPHPQSPVSSLSPTRLLPMSKHLQSIVKSRLAKNEPLLQLHSIKISINLSPSSFSSFARTSPLSTTTINIETFLSACSIPVYVHSPKEFVIMDKYKTYTISWNVMTTSTPSQTDTCSYSIYSQGYYFHKGTISLGSNKYSPFDATPALSLSRYSMVPDPDPQASNDPECEFPFIHNGLLMCLPSCYGELVLTSDGCVLDCYAKYGIYKPWLNISSGYCDTFPSCKIDFNSIFCFDENSTLHAEPCDDPSIHGEPSSDGLTCECYPGWEHSISENGSLTFCSSQIPVDPNISSTSGDSQFGGVLIFIVFFFAMFLGCLYLNPCCKPLRKKIPQVLKRITNKTTESDSDSDQNTENRDPTPNNVSSGSNSLDNQPLESVSSSKTLRDQNQNHRPNPNTNFPNYVSPTPFTPEMSVDPVKFAEYSMAIAENHRKRVQYEYMRERHLLVTPSDQFEAEQVASRSLDTLNELVGPDRDIQAQFSTVRLLKNKRKALEVQETAEGGYIQGNSQGIMQFLHLQKE